MTTCLQLTELGSKYSIFTGRFAWQWKLISTAELIYIVDSFLLGHVALKNWQFDINDWYRLVSVWFILESWEPPSLVICMKYNEFHYELKSMYQVPSTSSKKKNTTFPTKNSDKWTLPFLVAHCTSCNDPLHSHLFLSHWGTTFWHHIHVLLPLAAACLL